MKHQHLLISLSTLSDQRGRITIAQAGDHIPFAVGRLFVIDNVPPGGQRGRHAHRHQHELIFMISGTCLAVIDDGRDRSQILLSRDSISLYVPPMHWLELGDFSEDAVCNVLASGQYDKSGYIVDEIEFRRLTA